MPVHMQPVALQYSAAPVSATPDLEKRVWKHIATAVLVENNHLGDNKEDLTNERRVLVKLSKKDEALQVLLEAAWDGIKDSQDGIEFLAKMVKDMDSPSK
jgi:hypothetical protein